MNVDPNHYRYYICNLQTPKLKARELRISKGAEINGNVLLHSSDLITTGKIQSSEVLATDQVTTANVNTDTLESDTTSTKSLTVVGPTSITGSTKITSDIITVNPPIEINQGWGACEIRIYDRSPLQGLERNYLQLKSDPLVSPNGQAVINSVTENYPGVSYPILMQRDGIELAAFDKNVVTASNPVNIYPPSGTDKGASYLRLLCRDKYNDGNAGGIQIASSFLGPTYENAVSISGYKKGASEYPMFYILNGGTNAIIINKVGDVNIPTTLTVNTGTYSSWLIPKTIGCDVTIEFTATGQELTTNAPVFAFPPATANLTVNNFIPSFLSGGFVKDTDTTVNDDKAKFFAPVSGTYQIAVSARCVDNTGLGVGFLGDRAFGGSNIYAALPYSGVAPFTRDDAQRSMMAITFNLQLVQNQRFSVWQAITQTGNRWLWCKMNIRLINQA